MRGRGVPHRRQQQHANLTAKLLLLQNPNSCWHHLCGALVVEHRERGERGEEDQERRIKKRGRGVLHEQRQRNPNLSCGVVVIAEP